MGFFDKLLRKEKKIGTINYSDIQKEEHINDYLKSNCFLGARLGKITSHSEPGFISYSLQLFCNDELTLDQFKNNFLTEIQQKSLQKYATKVLTFMSEMEHISDYN